MSQVIYLFFIVALENRTRKMVKQEQNNSQNLARPKIKTGKKSKSQQLQLKKETPSF